VGDRPVCHAFLRACQGRRAWVAVWFQEWGLPVLVSLEMAAKSFVSRRGPNFYFSRPHKLLRRAVFSRCRRASTVGDLRACFHRGHRCWGFGRLLRIAIPMIQGMPSRHDCRTALSSRRTSVRLYPCQYLICYLYRCELGRLRLFFPAKFKETGRGFQLTPPVGHRSLFGSGSGCGPDLCLGCGVAVRGRRPDREHSASSLIRNCGSSGSRSL
jgi:hypothetical protein